MIKPYYQDSAVTIYHCDYRKILLELPEIDLVLTDPPYGLQESNTDKNKYESFLDNPQEVTEMVKNLLWFYKGKRFIMTPGQKQMFKYPEPDAIGAFYYPAGTGSCSWGFVGVNNRAGQYRRRRKTDEKYL